MIWCKKLSRNTSCVTLAMLGLVLLAPLHEPVACAQETLDSRYQKAVELFNQAKMEDACELFQQVAKEKPDYKDTQTYLNPACNSAKQTYALEERLFNQGVDLLKQERIDDAKQKFEQASKLVLKHPKYRAQIEGYMKQIEARSGDESSFQQAVKLFNDGKDDEAAKQFGQIEQGKSTRSADARTYLQRIQERREESLWNHAVDSFAQGDLSRARPLFQEIIQMKGKKSAEAQAYVGRIDTADSDQRAYSNAVRAFNDRHYSDAKTLFQSLVQKNSSHASDARSYLQRIDAALQVDASAREQAKRKLAETGQDAKQAAQQFIKDARDNMSQGQYMAAVEKLKAAEILDPGNREAHSMLIQAQESADEQPLREGLEAYFQGKYDEAEQDLGQYVDNHGRKLALAYFFRGAVHASRYYLSGERDAHQKELALVDFRTLQKEARQFQPPKEYVSPKILSLYAEAAGARSQ